MLKNLLTPITLALLLSTTSISSGATILSSTPQPDGLLLSLNPGTIRIQLFSPSTIRITAAPTEKLPDLHSLSVIAHPEKTTFTTQDSPTTITLSTSALQIQINKFTSAISFLTPDGKPILQESDTGREFPTPADDGKTSPVPPPARQSFLLPPDEALYGLGQHQQGLMNYRGHTLRLLQENREVAVPTLLSNKGYLLLWDNPAVTDLSIGAPITNSPPKANQPQPAGENITRWSSETAPAIDYYFCYGPSPDEAIHQYRTLTGPAPLLPRYAWGLWQSKERYRSSDELLDIAKKYRDAHIPIDGIIQDWRYWVDNTWGSHAFDKSRYPDPASTFKQLHELHFHNLISVWAKFDFDTDNFNELDHAGALFNPAIPYVYPPGKGKWYDPFNPEGRRLYWKELNSELFSLGIDGWWLDASEPELSGKWGEFRHFHTAAGPGAELFNAYPLMHTTGIYQGQRATTPDKRVIILTRSAYAGQQRNSAITWSGDIAGNWDTYRRQIPAGLNFSASGIPYWNTDTGGFFADKKAGNSDPNNPEYQELFTRWFQFSAFCPMLRIHGSAPSGGTGPGKEIFRFPPNIQSNLLAALQLRYRLVPYIYSLSWQVTNNGYTMMRPLVMDFPNDPNALNIPDQYLFGPALMVAPVTQKGATTRQVYLPKNTTWYNFYTAAPITGGQTTTAESPLGTIPLFIPAGTILPLGPNVQYANEKPDAPLELRIYPGRDAHFTLYEDAGDGYQYEQGQHATIPLTWSDKSKTLTLGERTGAYPNMPQHRTFNITFVHETHGAGPDPTPTPDATPDYSGQPLNVAWASRP